MRPAQSRVYQCEALAVFFKLSVLFFISFSAYAQPAARQVQDTILYKGFTGSPSFSLFPESWDGCMLSDAYYIPGQTYMVAYAPGQVVNYNRMVKTGIYLLSDGKWENFMSEKQADSLKLIYKKTNVKSGSDIEIDVAYASLLAIPCNKFWNSELSCKQQKLLIFSKAEFKCVYIGLVSIRIPDFYVKKNKKLTRLNGYRLYTPTYITKVPAYFVTEIKTFTTKKN